MSILNPIIMLKDKRKEIYDIIFKEYNETSSFDMTREKIANILLDIEEDKLDELKEEVINSDNPIELLNNKGKEINKEKIDLPSNIQL